MLFFCADETFLQVNNQNPDPGTTIPIIDCAWTKQFITSAPPGSTFTVGGVVKPFIQVLMAELGGVNHLDRLTIFVSRPNRKKGSVSGIVVSGT